MHPAERYAKDVIAGKIPVCEQVIGACKRYFDDLETGVDRGLYFDRKAAQRSIKFFQFLRHYKGKYEGKVFELDGWQQFVLWNMFGWMKSNGKRRFRYAYVAVPRKNGKTALLSGIGLYMLMADGENAAEIYTAATKREQARLCFDDSSAMVESSPALRNRVKVFTNSLNIPATRSKMAPLSSDSKKQDGTGPHGGIIDEYHGHANDGMFKVLKSGMGGREQPIMWIITTAGFNKLGPCKKYQDKCEKVLKGIVEQDNLFAMIFTTDKGDDWNDEATWIKANPSYYSITTLQDFLKEEYIDAKNDSSMQVNFKTKNLNMWVDSEDVWIEDEKYMACTGEELQQQAIIEKLKGRTCYGGLDLASVEDLSSLGLYFPATKTEPACKITFFWVPEETVSKRVERDDIPYDEWVRDGWVMATPGNIQDYDAIRQFISGVRELDGTMTESEDCVATWFDLKSIAYDRYNSSQLVVDLMKDDLEMTPFGQGFVSMSFPTKEFVKLILKKDVLHFGNPIVRWQISNVSLQRDAAGNVKVSKEKSKEKVDGVVSDVMAYGEYLSCDADDTDAYENHGIRTV